MQYTKPPRIILHFPTRICRRKFSQQFFQRTEKCYTIPSGNLHCNRAPLYARCSPHAGFSARTASTAASISGAVLDGCRCGQRLWLQRHCPSAARMSHLYPVFRLMTNSRHRALMFDLSLDARSINFSRSFPQFSAPKASSAAPFCFLGCLYYTRKLLPMSLLTCYLYYYSIHQSPKD